MNPYDKTVATTNMFTNASFDQSCVKDAIKNTKKMCLVCTVREMGNGNPGVEGRSAMIVFERRSKMRQKSILKKFGRLLFRNTDLSKVDLLFSIVNAGILKHEYWYANTRQGQRNYLSGRKSVTVRSVRKLFLNRIPCQNFQEGLFLVRLAAMFLFSPLQSLGPG